MPISECQEILNFWVSGRGATGEKRGHDGKAGERGVLEMAENSNKSALCVYCDRPEKEHYHGVTGIYCVGFYDSTKKFTPAWEKPDA